MYRKGTTLLRKRIKHPLHGKMRQVILPLHTDMIQEKFWQENKEILELGSSSTYDFPEGEVLPEIVLQQLHMNLISDMDVNDAANQLEELEVK